MFEKLTIVNLLPLLMIMAESYQSDFCQQEGNILKCLSMSEISSVNSYKHVEVTLSSVQIMPPAIIVFCIVTLFFRPGSDWIIRVTFFSRNHYANCWSLTKFHFQELVIEGSNLTDIDFELLQNVRYLKNLTLVHSDLHTMKNTSFSNAKYIIDINLSYNNISR